MHIMTIIQVSLVEFQKCSPLSLLGAELTIAKEYFVSRGTLSER